MSLFLISTVVIHVRVTIFALCLCMDGSEHLYQTESSLFKKIPFTIFHIYGIWNLSKEFYESCLYSLVASPFYIHDCSNFIVDLAYSVSNLV